MSVWVLCWLSSPTWHTRRKCFMENFRNSEKVKIAIWQVFVELLQHVLYPKQERLNLSGHLVSFQMICILRFTAVLLGFHDIVLPEITDWYFLNNFIGTILCRYVTTTRVKRLRALIFKHILQYDQLTLRWKLPQTTVLSRSAIVV